MNSGEPGVGLYASGPTAKPDLNAFQVPSFIIELTKLGALTRQYTAQWGTH